MDALQSTTGVQGMGLMILVLVTLVILWLITLFLFFRHRRRSKRKIHKLFGRLAVKSHETAKAIVDHEGRCTKIVDTLNEGLLMVNAARQIVFANDRACELMKMPVKKLLLQDISVLTPGASEANRIVDILKKRPARGYREELQLLRGTDDTFWAGLSISFPKDIKEIEGGAVVLIVDVSDHINLEKKMHKYTASLVQKVRQLDCIFAIQEMIGDSSLGADELFKKALKIIPQGLRYEKDMAVEIVYRDRRYASRAFHEGDWTVKAPMRVKGKTMGHITVSFNGSIAYGQSRPFKMGEKALIRNLADKLVNAPAVQQLRND